MIAPGLISAIFYRRPPSRVQIALGSAFTIVVSGLLGYLQDMGTSFVWANTVIAIVGGLILYFAILAYLVYVYFPKRAKADSPAIGPP